MSLSRHHIVFGLAIVLLVALAAWWTTFIVRSVEAERSTALELEALRAQVHETDRGGDVASHRIDRSGIDARHDRRMVMILGEGTLMFALLGVCIMMLVRIQRQDRRQLGALQSFISVVTHEMKTPLSGIKSLLQTSRAGNLPADRAQEILTMGLAETERLEHMIENVLVAGRLRVDQKPVQMTILSLASFLGELVAHRAMTLSCPDRLVLDLGGCPDGLEALADADDLRVILDNLVDNAFKYGGDDPVVRIEVSTAGGSIFIDVTDRGIGLPPDEAEAVFEPFYRTVSGKSPVTHGTGLGLSIARTLARRMGGDVKAHSEGPGRGTRMRVSLVGRPT